MKVQGTQDEKCLHKFKMTSPFEKTDKLNNFLTIIFLIYFVSEYSKLE
jgi:hypothetical protein